MKSGYGAECIEHYLGNMAGAWSPFLLVCHRRRDLGPAGRSVKLVVRDQIRALPVILGTTFG